MAHKPYVDPLTSTRWRTVAGVMPAEDLDEFDLDRIPPWRGLPAPPPAPPAGWRRGLTAGAFLSAVALGLRDVFDPEPDRTPEVAPARRDRDDGPIMLLFDPDEPRNTIALVFQ
jgi:hypothetical protein